MMRPLYLRKQKHQRNENQQMRSDRRAERDAVTATHTTQP